MKRLLAVALVAVAATAFAADRGFDRLVSDIENHYGVKRTHIPMMGLANFVVKVARPAGTRGFKIAIFENFRVGEYGDQRSLDHFIANACRGSQLHPMIVTHSRGSGESSYILAGESGKNTKLLIATFERNEATVIQVEVDAEALARTLNSPAQAHRWFRGEHTENRDWDDR